MAERVHRHDQIAYDGSNSTQMLAFFSNVNGSIATWSIESESGGQLTLRCEFSGAGGPFGPPPPYVLTVNEGDVFTKSTDMTGSDSFQGPWPPEQLAAAFAVVPTAADLNSLQTALDELSARVAALEPQEAP